VLEHQRILNGQAFRRVRLEVHGGIDEEIAALVILGDLGDPLSKDVLESGQGRNRFLTSPSSRASCNRSFR
jgi:hypothetical protein